MPEETTEEITLHLGGDRTRTIRLKPGQKEVFVEWMDAETPSRRTMMLDGIEYRRDEIEAFSMVQPSD
jgi:hypothetical protein